jgi:hypothetical protein
MVVEEESCSRVGEVMGEDSCRGGVLSRKEAVEAGCCRFCKKVVAFRRC